MNRITNADLDRALEAHSDELNRHGLMPDHARALMTAGSDPAPIKTR